MGTCLGLSCEPRIQNQVFLNLRQVFPFKQGKGCRFFPKQDERCMGCRELGGRKRRNREYRDICARVDFSFQAFCIFCLPYMINIIMFSCPCIHIGTIGKASVLILPKLDLLHLETFTSSVPPDSRGIYLRPCPCCNSCFYSCLSRAQEGRGLLLRIWMCWWSSYWWELQPWTPLTSEVSGQVD